MARPPGMAKPVRNPRILHGEGHPIYPKKNPGIRKNPGITNWKQALAAMSVKNQQTVLRKRGYHIAVDGIEGPQTKAARTAFLNGTNPHFYNKRAAMAHVPGGPGGGGPVGGRRRHAGGGGGGAGGGSGRGAGGGGGGGGAGGGGGGGLDYTDGLINPMDYAKGSVEAEYGPQLGQMQRDIGQQRAQGGQDIADLTSWFKQLEGTRAQGQTANEAAAQQQIAALNQGAQGMAQALGDVNGAGGVAAAYAGGNQAGLQGIASSQGNFDRNMQSILASQGIDARRGEMNKQSQIMADLIGKRQDLFHSKGAALSKALAEAQILRTQQRGQNISQSAQLQQLGLDKALGGLKIRQGNQAINLNARQAAQQAKAAQLDYDVKSAQYQDFLDNLKQTHGGKLDFGTLDEQSRLGLAHSIATMASGPGGHFVGNVNQTWKKIRSGLEMAGYDLSDPAIKRFGLGILRTIPGYNRAAHPKHHKR